MRGVTRRVLVDSVPSTRPPLLDCRCRRSFDLVSSLTASGTHCLCSRFSFSCDHHDDARVDRRSLRALSDCQWRRLLHSCRHLLNYCCPSVLHTDTQTHVRRTMTIQSMNTERLCRRCFNAVSRNELAPRSQPQCCRNGLLSVCDFVHIRFKLRLQSCGINCHVIYTTDI